MHRRRFALLIAIGLAALCLGARTLPASNMGFIVNCPLTATGPSSRSGTQTLNLPYQRDAQLQWGSHLLSDLGLVNVANLQRFLETTDSLVVYTGRKGDGGVTNFVIQPGACYFIRMLTPVDYVMGGSSDSQVALELNAAGPGSWSGTNFVSLPYHVIPRTAGELMDDIGLANVTSVQRFLTKTDSLHVYTGRKGSPPDFPLDPCECYFIKMNTTVSYIPSHY
jgi:hypothetical protein